MRSPDDHLADLMHLVDVATNQSYWTTDGGPDSDEVEYDDNPMAAWERRVRISEVAALGAIVLLLLRRDAEAQAAWEKW